MGQLAAEPLEELHGDHVGDSPVEEHYEESTWEQEEQIEPVTQATTESFGAVEPTVPVVIEESMFESREAEDAPARRAEDRESVWASPSSLAPQGTIEEEEIEEKEADIAHYVEELEEDATFEELERKRVPQKSIASRSPNSSLLASRSPRRFRVTMAPESEQRPKRTTAKNWNSKKHRLRPRRYWRLNRAVGK